MGDEPPLRPHPVDPPGVGRAVDDLGLLEQVEDEGLVRGAALDDHRRLAHRPPQPRQRLVAVGPVRDDLGDHRVEVGGDGVALGHPGVDPDARPGRQLEVDDAARGRGEVAVGVLGVEAGLHGVAELLRALALEPAAGGDVQLQAHEVGAGDDLGDRVLDLQPGVDLEEGEEPLPGVVEELDGAGAGVADGERQPLGRGLELGDLRGVEHRRRRLLDDLLVAALHRAVADPDRPRGALAVGDDLDLDVAGAGDQLLEEHHTGAEGTLGLLAGALVRGVEVGVRGDLADAAPAAPGRGLEHQRVPDAGRGLLGLLEGLDPAAAPRGDRDADLLGDELGADLVAEPAHRLRAGADEGDADPAAQLREGRVLGDEAPADPHRVGPGAPERTLELGVVEVGALRRGPEVVGVVGLPDEHRGALGLGVERDDLHAVPVRAGRGVEVADGVDEPHRGLTPVDDGDPREHAAEPATDSR